MFPTFLTLCIVAGIETEARCTCSAVAGEGEIANPGGGTLPRRKNHIKGDPAAFP